MNDLGFEPVPQTDDPSRVVVALRGAIDGRNVPGFSDRLDKLVRPGTKRVVLDMTHVTMIASAALGYLMNLADTLGERGGGVTIACIQPKVKDVFSLLGLTSFFTFQATRDEDTAAPA